MLPTESSLNSNQQIEQVLMPVFGQMPTFLSDSPDIVGWLNERGYDAYVFHKDGYSIPPKSSENVVIFAMDHDASPAHQEWQALFDRSRVLFIPLASFEPSMAAMAYTFDILTRSSFERATALNDLWLQRLLKYHAPMHLKGNKSYLECSIAQDVYAMTPKTTAQLEPGEWESIGAFFEVGMVAQADDSWPAFNVNGTVSVEGVVVAHHRWMPDGLVPQATRAWELFQEVRQKGLFPLHVELEHSRVVKVLAGQQNLAPELDILTNKRRQLVLTEMAFSTNECLEVETINWGINHQLNEGTLGIHFGLGDGVTGAHIDFICPGVALQDE